MADKKKQANAGAGGGGKAVEPAPQPAPSLFTRLMRAPQFFAEVRQEALKVTWPTWDETRVTTIAVFIMIAMAIVFFALVDFVISTAVKWILG
jgi:preprotein translocase subunit SecE